MARILHRADAAPAEQQEREMAAAAAGNLAFRHDDMGGYSADEEAAAMQAGGFAGSGAAGFGGNPLTDPRFANISRNDACPCGSGKKFKHCHGALS